MKTNFGGSAGFFYRYLFIYHLLSYTKYISHISHTPAVDEDEDEAKDTDSDLSPDEIDHITVVDSVLPVQCLVV